MKHQLHDCETANNKQYNISLSLDQFNEIISPIVENTIQVFDEAIADSSLDLDEINNIILVGGSTRIKLIKQKLIDKYNIKILDNLNPDTVVAAGAAIQAEILSGNSRDEMLLLDVLPLSLGVETYGGFQKRLLHVIPQFQPRMRRHSRHSKMVRQK